MFYALLQQCKDDTTSMQNEANYHHKTLTHANKKYWPKEDGLQKHKLTMLQPCIVVVYAHKMTRTHA